ncbi:hypothetical protein [Mycoplasma suis]|uniref:Uncharacterized protein n=2 Tax=Mycoplasma suis TaxID=57372 RepID=F0QS98_MYCSL|nr:hypothetical protein [Mycoplasma suis]ADX98368.1 hypothetical protein MSU_0855 [Mycoplasma suis str. Illinois]CBZ40876.1 hypothetical protein MSUIS_07830 [Mycoplasma suis KI3806]
MFVKEIFSIFTFLSLTFFSSGFAIKVKKYEHNQLIVDPVDKKTKVFLTEKSYYKLNPKTLSDFKYLVKGDIPISKNISEITQKGNLYELTLTPSENHLGQKIELIKYFVESKSFWSNLFS